jgi:hypothetical protein
MPRGFTRGRAGIRKFLCQICLHTCLRLRHNNSSHGLHHSPPTRAAIHSSLPIIQGEVVRRLSLAKCRHWLRSRRQSHQRHEPAAGPFHNHMFNPILKSAKSSHDTFDVDLYLFDASCGKWRHGSLQPDWIDLVDGQPVAAGREKKLRIAAISAADRLHSGAPHSGYAQQTQELHRGVRLAYAGVRSGNGRLMRLVSPDPTQPVRDSRLSFPSSNGKSLRHLCCPTFPRRRDPGAALTRRRFARD